MRADRKDPVIARLRRLKATHFAVTVGDDIKEIPLSTKANKWEQLLDILETLRWTVIEAQDDKRQVLGRVERDVEDEDTGDEYEDDDRDIRRVEQLTKLMSQVQSNTMLEVRRMFSDQVKVFADMAGSMMDAMRVMQDSYQTAIRMTAAAATTGGAEGSEDQVMKMLQMAFAMKFGGPMPTFGGSPKPAAPAPQKVAPAARPQPIRKPPIVPTTVPAPQPVINGTNG
jgi:hypothetical protein